MKRIESSVLPFLLSIELFNRAHENSPNERYQLPARCAHFSGILNSLNMGKEALLTLSLAMKAHVMENTDTSKQNTSDTCLLFCYDYVTQNTKTCIELNTSPYTARFTRIYFQSAVKQCGDNRLQNYIKNIPDLQFGSTLTSIPKNKLLSYSISSILLSHDHTPSMPILCILFDFCNYFLKEIYQHYDTICSDSPTNLAVLVEDFEGGLEEVSAYLQCRGEPSLHLDLVLISIMKCRIWYKTSFPSSSQKIQDHIENVEEKLQIAQEAFHLFEYQAAILIYQASVLFFKAFFLQEFNRTNNKKHDLVESSFVVDALNNVASKCTEILDLLSKNNETEIPNRFLISLFVTKSRFLQAYECDGFDFLSSPLMFGHNLLHTNNESTSTSAIALEAPLRVFGQLYCSCFPKKTKILRHLFDACLKNGKTITHTLNPDELDVLLKKIQQYADMAQTRKRDICDIQFQELLLEMFTNSRELSLQIENSDDEHIETTLHLLYQTLTDYNIAEYCEDQYVVIITDADFILLMGIYWLSSSYYLSLANGFKKEGNLTTAVHLTLKCLKYCKSFIRRVKQQHEIQRTDDDNILSLTSSEEIMFIRPFILRAALSLENLSTLYSQLGEYRRANSYAVGMAESVGVLSHRDVISRTCSISDIIRKMNSSFQYVRHSQARRHLINILSLSKPQNKVGGEFLDAAGTVASETNVNLPHRSTALDWNMSIDLNNLDWLQERIHDFVLCKLKCVTTIFSC